jgi:hypothetical protein
MRPKIKNMKTMKIWFGMMMAALLSLLVLPEACAQDFWSGAGTAMTTNLSYYVLSAKYRPANVEVIAGECDLPTAQLRFYNASSNSITITNALSAGLSNVLVSATNGLAAGDIVVIRDVTNDQYQRMKICSLTAGSLVVSNDLLLTATTSFALASGDQVWRMTLAGQQPWRWSAGVANLGTNILSCANSGFFHTAEGKPGLVELGVPSSSTCTNAAINFISGTYGVPRK